MSKVYSIGNAVTGELLTIADSTDPDGFRCWETWDKGFAEAAVTVMRTDPDVFTDARIKLFLATNDLDQLTVFPFDVR